MFSHINTFTTVSRYHASLEEHASITLASCLVYGGTALGCLYTPKRLEVSKTSCRLHCDFAGEMFQSTVEFKCLSDWTKGGGRKSDSCALEDTKKETGSKLWVPGWDVLNLRCQLAIQER